jgi:hypothetical protein
MIIKVTGSMIRKIRNPGDVNKTLFNYGYRCIYLTTGTGAIYHYIFMQESRLMKTKN